MIDRYRLGVVADPVPGHERYLGYLSIPYLTPFGVTSIRFRRLEDGDGPKYLTMPGDIPRIYNVEALQRGTRSICLTEGELDCIIAESCGLPCIGLPGAQAWKPLFARLLGSFEWVFLLQDDDEAGEAMTRTISKDLPNLRAIPMDGGDVNSFVLEHGREALKERVIR